MSPWILSPCFVIMVDTQVDTALSKTGPFTLSIVTDADVINQTLADFSVIVSAKNLLFISVKTNESIGTSPHSQFSLTAQ